MLDQNALWKLTKYIINNEELYLYTQQIIKNLKRHVEHGSFDHNKALESWQSLAEKGYIAYSTSKTPVFTKEDISAVAKYLAAYYADRYLTEKKED